jgi:hypothetical protein
VSPIQLAPDPAPFLDPEQLPDLPIGMSLDLIQIPVVLAAKQRVGLAPPRAGDDRPGVLPEQYVRMAVTLAGRGVRRTVVVEGSPTLGLPYGDDADVLLALFRLVHDDQQRVLLGHEPRVVDGEFLSPSLTMIANALQAQRGGSQRRQIRTALERLANVRIKTSSEFFRDTREHAARIVDGHPDAHPVVPQARPDRVAPGRVVSATEKITWLLEYEWRRDFSRNEDGEDWITRLRLNPVWCAHGASGWVAWIEMPIFRALGPAAKRLYMHLATRAACEGMVPWTFDAAELGRTCAPLASSNAQALKYLRAAADALREAGVVAEWQEVAERRADRRFTFHAGPVLTLAAHLRGAGTFDPDDVRLQFAALQFFGVDVAEARRWLAEHPTATRDALCYAIFLRETNPARVRSSWPAMMRERILNRRTNVGEVGYEAWAARRLASGPAAHPFPAPPVAGAVERTAPRLRGPKAAARPGRHAASDAITAAESRPSTAGDPAPDAPPGSPEAVALWRAIRAAIDPGQTMLALSCLDALAPIAIDGDVLVVHDTNGSGEYALRNLGAQLGAYAAANSGGAIVTVRRRPPTPADER